MVVRYVSHKVVLHSLVSPKGAGGFLRSPQEVLFSEISEQYTNRLWVTFRGETISEICSKTTDMVVLEISPKLAFSKIAPQAKPLC